MNKIFSRLFKSNTAKIILLAALYIATGKLGLLLSVAPGYANIIWPASGVAIGMLILHGRSLWPGVFLGSFILNCFIGGAFSLEDSFDFDRVIISLGISIGSALQALAGFFLTQHFIGLPLKFRGMRQMFWLFLLCGPIACIISSTCATLTLYFSGILPTEQIAINWTTWWLGDLFGIMVALPLMLIAPGSENKLTINNNRVEALPLLAMLILIVPLGLTFYAWRISSQNAYENAYDRFNTMAIENEKALLHRIDTYDYALLGMVGFLQGSDFVSREDWHNYINKINLSKNFPGINGIGFITNVHKKNIPGFLNKIRADNYPDFKIHPNVSNDKYYITTYLEPENLNNKMIGLNLAFEKNRRVAADISRDIGRSTITNKIILLQEKSAGFLLLQPLYKPHMPINTIKERRQALWGWVFAPFVAKNFMGNLTNSQNDYLHLEVYDGTIISPETLIFQDEKVQNTTDENKPVFMIKKKLTIMQKEWTLVWKSTKAYEQQNRTDTPLLVLVGGLVFTGLFALFLMVVTIRSTQTMERLSGERNLSLPILIFIIVSIGAFYLYVELNKRELAYVKNIVNEETNNIEQLISFQANDAFFALKRMAQRWETSMGTPEHYWRADAENHLKQLPGLKALEWADNTHHVRWVEPLKGNENVVGINIRFDKQRALALKGASEKSSITLTPPLDAIQGYKAFIVYAPIQLKKKFDGYIVGVFSVNDFINDTITNEISSNYAISFDYNGTSFFKGNADNQLLNKKMSTQSTFYLYDKKWTIRVTPTNYFVESQQTSLPFIVFVAGLLIAILLSLTVRYILISRLKSDHLKASEETFRAAMEYASIGMALISLDGKWLAVNQAICQSLGYTEKELQAIDFQKITHPEDLKKDLDYLHQMLRGEIQTYQMEKRYFNKDGHIIWVLLSVSLARYANGQPKHFISQIQNITQQKEIDRLKGEFISVVSHELRTPLTAIRGSLGLIMGTMAKELSEKVSRLINIAHENSERLILLINDILDIDKIASGQMRFNLKEEAVAPILQKAIEANQAYADKYHVHIQLKPVDHHLKIHVDADRLIQILSNFLSNAAKFSHKNGIIEVSAHLIKNKVRISVQDFGVGMPDEFLGRVFERFSQADTSISREKGGTGLGLSISKEMIEHMSGQIGFETKLGKGSTFWAEFPTVIKEYEPITPLSHGADQFSEQTEPLPRILHIEDDNSLIRFFSDALHNKAELISANTLAQANSLLQDQEFSLIILDLGLPDGSGIDFLNDLYNTSHKHTPVVILSATEAPQHIKDKVLASIVKSRMSETIVVENILNIIQKHDQKI